MGARGKVGEADMRWIRKPLQCYYTALMVIGWGLPVTAIDGVTNADAPLVGLGLACGFRNHWCRASSRGTSASFAHQPPHTLEQQPMSGNECTYTENTELVV